MIIYGIVEIQEKKSYETTGDPNYLLTNVSLAEFYFIRGINLNYDVFVSSSQQLFLH